jgi:cellulose biosynthesis protein BcsQ
VRQAAGVYDVLRGRQSLASCLIRTRVEGLSIAPAGLQAVTTSVLRRCDDVLGVLQAEALSARAFQSLVRFLDQFAEQGRPRLGGIVVNMFQYQPGGQAVVHDAPTA